jgi:hypothetical protein
MKNMVIGMKRLAAIGRLFRRGSAGERGQIVLMSVAFLTLLFLIGAFAVDAGLWFSEKRDLQKVADAGALAGAQEYFDDPIGAWDTVAATDAALHWANRNGADDGDTDVLITTGAADCRGDGDQMPWVEVRPERDSPLFFSGLIGVAGFEIPAVARACAGSLRATQGLRPWVVSMYNTPCFDWLDDGDGVKEADQDQFTPQFGEDCIFRLESPSSQVGSVRLGDDPGDLCNEPGGGADKYRENIVDGADAVCEIGDLIDTEPGLNVGPTLQALEDLLAGEGECDTKNGDLDGIDQFVESFEAASDIAGPDAIFVARDCTTPRAIHIVILDEFDGTGFDTRPIEGFAAFFLTQCERLDHDGNVVDIRPKCDFSGGGGGSSFQIRGFFMRTVVLEGDIGDFDEFGTSAIRLVK